MRFEIDKNSSVWSVRLSPPIGGLIEEFECDQLIMAITTLFFSHLLDISRKRPEDHINGWTVNMREEDEDTIIEEIEYTQLIVYKDGDISYHVVYNEEDGLFSVLHFHALAGSFPNNDFNEEDEQAKNKFYDLLSVYFENQNSLNIKEKIKTGELELNMHNLNVLVFHMADSLKGLEFLRNVSMKALCFPDSGYNDFLHALGDNACPSLSG